MIEKYNMELEVGTGKVPVLFVVKIRVKLQIKCSDRIHPVGFLNLYYITRPMTRQENHLNHTNLLTIKVCMLKVAVLL